MELKKKSNILDEEEPKYIISLKKGYRNSAYHNVYILLVMYAVFWNDIISCRYRYDGF